MYAFLIHNTKEGIILYQFHAPFDIRYLQNAASLIGSWDWDFNFPVESARATKSRIYGLERIGRPQKHHVTCLTVWKTSQFSLAHKWLQAYNNYFSSSPLNGPISPRREKLRFLRLTTPLPPTSLTSILPNQSIHGIHDGAAGLSLVFTSTLLFFPLTNEVDVVEENQRRRLRGCGGKHVLKAGFRSGGGEREQIGSWRERGNHKS